MTYRDLSSYKQTGIRTSNDRRESASALPEHIGTPTLGLHLGRHRALLGGGTTHTS